MSERIDVRDLAWPQRPWLMAALCAVAGLLFDVAADFSVHTPVSPLRQAAAAFVAIAALSFAMTVEQRRWRWTLGFALGWGTVVALVGWFTARYNQVPNIFEFPFLSGIFAVLLAAPLFQTVRDEGAWRFPYPRLHRHAWTDAVIGAASLGFVGVAFLLAALISGLFGLIGIDLVKNLLREEWFEWTLAGCAFGSAVGMLRERDQLAATLQRLAMMILGVLAPVLAVALALFLLSLPFTGLGKLWASQIPATPLMLAAGAFATLLANAIIGDGGDEDASDARSTRRLLRLAAIVLVVAVLPLAIIAAFSLGQRVGQHGWTPERIWGAVAVAAALVYGAMGWWAVAGRREGFDEALRPLQVRLAIGLCGAALLLALPIVDFGAISARSQIDRLASGRTPPGRFDWKAMAFDFGPAGRGRLAEIARTGAADQRLLATAALATRDRYSIDGEIAARQSESTLAMRMRIVPAGATLSPDLRRAVAHTPYCRLTRCVLVLAGPDRAILAGALSARQAIAMMPLVRGANGRWTEEEALTNGRAPSPPVPDLATAPVELRTVQRRILLIDGSPLGQPFE